MERQYTFLISHGDLSVLEASSQTLQEMGHPSTLQAEDGPEAWALFKNFNIDFIICDLDLPEVNGMSFLRIVRSSEKGAVLPFLLTARQMTKKLVIQVGRAGVTDVMLWPFSAETLRRKVQEIIEEENSEEAVQVEQKYKEGVELMKAGRYEEALQSFENILSVQENAEVYFNMGYIETAKENYSQALKCFRRATQINNAFARAFKMMGEVYSKLGQLDEAEENLQKAADIYLERREDSEAEEIYLVVSRMKPDTTNVFNSLGIIYRRQGRLVEAVAQYEKALRVHPTDEHIHYNLARALLDLRNFKRAEGILYKALQINPSFSPARELLRAVEMGLTLSG
jgi:tetratricopeptide (TPR) repeat protein